VNILLRVEVLTTGTKKTTVLWGVTPCSLVEIYWRFEERSLYFYQNTRLLLHCILNEIPGIPFTNCQNDFLIAVQPSSTENPTAAVP
jgi:hypothetical protein